MNLKTPSVNQRYTETMDHTARDLPMKVDELVKESKKQEIHVASKDATQEEPKNPKAKKSGK